MRIVLEWGCYNGTDSQHCDNAAESAAKGEQNAVFSALAIGYLFLGGTGAGACVVLSVLELATANIGSGVRKVRGTPNGRFMHVARGARDRYAG